MRLSHFCIVAFIMQLAATEVFADEPRAFAFTLPPLVALGSQAAVKAEFNTRSAALGIEGIAVLPYEDVSDTEKQSGDSVSRKVQGGEVAAFLTKYSNSMMMSGLFWGIGIGYRELQTSWYQSADGLALQEEDYVDDDNQVEYRVRGRGVTGHLRFGYRYVGTEVPVVLGFYAGVRHFDGTYENVEEKTLVDAGENDFVFLKKRYMSQFEPGLELGMSF
ncbi:MAG: hypothetical protein AB7T49_01670 [Oligoflexales bacterium]